MQDLPEDQLLCQPQACLIEILVLILVFVIFVVILLKIFGFLPTKEK